MKTNQSHPKTGHLNRCEVKNMLILQLSIGVNLSNGMDVEDYFSQSLIKVTRKSQS